MMGRKGMDCHNKYKKFSTEVPWGVSDELLVEEEEKEGGKWFCYWIAFTVKNTATPRTSNSLMGVALLET